MMKHYDENIIRLIHLYLLGDLSDEGSRQLEEWLQKDSSRKEWFDRVCVCGNLSWEFDFFEKIDKDKAWKRVEEKGNIRKYVRFRSINRFKWVAAVVLPVMMAVAGYYLLNASGESSRVIGEVAEIVPGKSKAILRLANNQVIELSGEDETSLNIAEGIDATNSASGVVYPQQVAQGKPVYNVLEVPRGGEYTISLSDGTIVYLNSGSKLRYPVVFHSETREVSLSGEGYFEVKKDTARPFFVHVDNLKIKVYGTSFNVNTYHAGNIQTVLVEGKIGIREKDSDVEFAVKPGQLALYNRTKGGVEIRDVDVLPYVAWKNREFVFDDESLEDIMNTLSLWYNVDVFFQSNTLKQLHFTGHLRRYENISRILDAISEVTRVKFSIKERTIVVME